MVERTFVQSKSKAKGERTCQVTKGAKSKIQRCCKNLEYSSMVGCSTDDSLSPKKNKERVMFNHVAYGCVGTKEHKTERSQHCTFNGKSKDVIAVIQATYRAGEVDKG